jgi:hypothetical protein
MSGDIVERGQQPAAGRPAVPKPATSLPTLPPPAVGGVDLAELFLERDNKLLDEIERLRRTVRDRDEWNEHLVAEVSHLLLAVPRPFRSVVARRAYKLAHHEARQ